MPRRIRIENLLGRAPAECRPRRRPFADIHRLSVQCSLRRARLREHEGAGRCLRHLPVEEGPVGQGAADKYLSEYTMAQKRDCMLALGVVVLAFVLWASSSSKEGFQSVVNCVDQGYPSDFCMRVPAQAVISSGYCECANGQLGTQSQPGVCSCFPFNPTLPYYPTPVFRDWLR